MRAAGVWVTTPPDWGRPRSIVRIGDRFKSSGRNDRTGPESRNFRTKGEKSVALWEKVGYSAGFIEGTSRVLFTGTYDHTLDEKQRLAIPSEVRSLWDEAEDGEKIFYAIPWPGGILRLYTQTHFRRLAASRSLTLTPDEDEAELQATLFGLARRLEMDKAGRVRLSEDYLALAGLGKELTLVGSGDRLEIHNRDAWKASVADGWINCRNSSGGSTRRSSPTRRAETTRNTRRVC